MKRRTKIILLASILLFIGLVIFLSSHKNNLEENNKTRHLASRNIAPLEVTYDVIKYSTLDDNFYTIGSTLASEEVNLSFEASGKIVAIYFKEGTHVKKGTLLAKSNDAPLQAQLKKLQAQLELQIARVRRQKQLLDKEAISKDAYEQSLTEQAGIEADIDLVKANINLTELRAPFDGMLGLKNVSEGQYMTPDLVVTKLTQISPLKIEFAINERLANDLKVGKHITFRLQESTQRYDAIIYAVSSQIDTKTRTLTARALYTNKNQSIKPGRSINVEVQLNTIQNAIIVPSEAMISEMGRDIVYVYRNGVAKLVEVTKGMRTEAKVQVLQGLKVGDTLITSGTMQLRDDSKVTLKNNKL